MASAGGTMNHAQATELVETMKKVSITLENINRRLVGIEQSLDAILSFKRKEAEEK